jgi:hypothetical protein
MPDCVTISDGQIVDTICMSTNIANLTSVGDSAIVIGFVDKPARYNELIKIPQKVAVVRIAIDTRFIVKPKTIQ